MNILITGAGGMLGTDLVLQLSPHFSVSGLGRTRPAHLSIPFYLCDLTHPEEITKIIAQVKPDLVFHCAAMTNVDQCELKPDMAFLHNAEATKNLVVALNNASAHLIFFSTDYIFSGNKTGEYEEEDPTAPLNKYGESKLLAENYIRKLSANYNIFRVAWLYGLYGKCYPRTILEIAKEQKVLQIVDDQRGRPTNTQDIAIAFKYFLLNSPKKLYSFNTETFHLANNGETNWADFAQEIIELAHIKDVVVKKIDSTMLNRPAKRPLNSVFNLNKIHCKLNMRLPDWTDSLKCYLANYLQSKQMSQ